METIFILFVLIVALIGLVAFIELVGLRKESESKEIFITKLIDEIVDTERENKELKNTNKAYKGANTKHKNTIEELKEEHEKIFNISNVRFEILTNKLDESKVVCEALLNLVKKGKMDEAKEIVKQYYKM